MTSLPLRGLFMITRNNVMSSLTYRAHFIFQTMASIFGVAVMFFLWKAIYQASGTDVLRGMTFNQTFLYMALASAMIVLTRTWVDWGIWEQIRFGTIIMQFFRPLDYMGGTFFNSLGIFIGNFITITLPSLLAIFLFFGGTLSLGWVSLLFIPALFLAFVLNFAFDWLIGTTCFYTESIWGISITKEVLILFLSGALIPLPFFPDSVRKVLEILPFASMYHTPLSILTNPAMATETILWSLMVQALWAIGLLVLCRVYFNAALKKLTVAGG